MRGELAIELPESETPFARRSWNPTDPIAEAAVMSDKPKTLADFPAHSVSHGPPLTKADRLQHIERLGKRIDAYVQTICQVGSLNGTSPAIQGVISYR